MDKALQGPQDGREVAVAILPQVAHLGMTVFAGRAFAQGLAKDVPSEVITIVDSPASQIGGVLGIFVGLNVARAVPGIPGFLLASGTAVGMIFALPLIVDRLRR